MDFKKIILFVSLLISACSQKQENSGWFVVHDETTGYELGVPSDFSYKSNESSDYYFGYSSKSQEGNYSIQTTLNRPHGLDCDKIGVSSPFLKSKEGLMGEVDFRFPKYNKYNPDPTPEEVTGVPCYPVPPATAAFALCSIKQDKNILICISQVRRNAGLAVSIFKTFQWTQ